MKLKSKKIKALPLLFVCMLLSSMFIFRAQSEIYSDNLPILVSLDKMGFGDVYPGQKVEKNFTVSYSGHGDGKYTVAEKIMPKMGVTAPANFNGSVSAYCQDNPADYSRCYRNLCPYISVTSTENEGDVINMASVSANDASDVWKVALTTPAIMGKVTQSYNGSFVSESGEFGCDLSFDVAIESAPVCGNGKIEANEDCDDGNKTDGDSCSSTCRENKGSISGCIYNDANDNGAVDSKEAKLSGREVQLVTCPYAPMSAGSETTFVGKSAIKTDAATGLVGYCSIKARTTTGADGCYSFANLGKGDYGVNAADVSGWALNYPKNNTFYYFNLSAGEDMTGMDFLNHQEKTDCTATGTTGGSATKAYITNDCSSSCQKTCNSSCGSSCSSTTDVTAKVKSADGQTICQSLSSGQTKYIYLQWNLNVPDGAHIDSATLKLKRQESGVDVSLQRFANNNWSDLSADLNTFGSYGVYTRDMTNFVTNITAQGDRQVLLRMKYSNPTSCHGCLDWADLVVKYTVVAACNVCGNSKIEAGETCDDGNANSGDGCSSVCKTEAPVCGNGRIEGGETCDDGNKKGGDGCSQCCKIEAPVCGNHRVEDGEGCDDGNTVSGDLCSNKCQIELPVCGNGRIEEGENCDDGNTNNGDKCSSRCEIELPYCGNGRLEEGETCDDGNRADGDKCSSGCRIETPFCGNKRIEEGETCDDGNVISGDKCSSTCQVELPYCGNGRIDAGERCDDGNKTDGDGCSSVCQKEYPVCGNGKVEAGETCDDGNGRNGDGCSTQCQIEKPSCGNGKLESGEACDDGNHSNGDGCTACCTLEAVCGNGLKENGEDCDDGNNSNGDRCSSSCKLTPICGDGIREGDETCDDHNLIDDDGCSKTCSTETVVCGDGDIDGNETCDDGNTKNGDGCNSSCRVEEPECGNGKVESGESCDDGNETSGDGCNSSCQTESHGCSGCGGCTKAVIKEEKVIDITEVSAKFTWLTSKKADSRVVCGEISIPKSKLKSKPSYGYDFSTSTYDINPKVTSHNLTVFELKPDTVYYCRVISSTSCGEVKSEELMFRTEKHKIIEPPIVITDLYIYNLKLRSVSQTCVNLEWQTNIKGTSCVVYGGSTKSLGVKPKYGYEWNTSRCSDTSKQYTVHSEQICGLNPCTTYYFRLASTNGSQDAVTAEQQVRTMCQKTSTYYPTVYVPAVTTTVETGKVAAASTEKCDVCEVCDKAQETVKTVIEKERYMTCEDWLILLLILIILILLINALVSRNRRRRDEEENVIPMGGVLTKRIDEREIPRDEIVPEENKLD